MIPFLFFFATFWTVARHLSPPAFAFSRVCSCLNWLGSDYCGSQLSFALAFYSLSCRNGLYRHSLPNKMSFMLGHFYLPMEFRWLFGFHHHKFEKAKVEHRSPFLVCPCTTTTTTTSKQLLCSFLFRSMIKSTSSVMLTDRPLRLCSLHILSFGARAARCELVSLRFDLIVPGASFYSTMKESHNQFSFFGNASAVIDGCNIHAATHLHFCYSQRRPFGRWCGNAPPPQLDDCQHALLVSHLQYYWCCLYHRYHWRIYWRL